jgi:hypothetical protein
MSKSQLLCIRWYPLFALALVGLGAACSDEGIENPEENKAYFTLLNDATSGLKEDAVNWIYQRQDGTFLLATPHNGIAVLRDGKIVAHYDTANTGISSNGVFQIEGTGSTIWIRHGGGKGVSYMIGDDIFSCEKASSVPGISYIAVSEDGSLWLAGSRFWRYVPTSDSLIEYNVAERGDRVWCNGGKTYIGGLGSFGEIDETGRYRAIIDPENRGLRYPRDMAFPKKGGAYIGTMDSSLAYWDGSSFFERWTIFNGRMPEEVYGREFSNLALDREGTLYIVFQPGYIGAMYPDGSFLGWDVVGYLYSQELKTGSRKGLNHILCGSDNRLYVAGSIGLLISKRALK